MDADMKRAIVLAEQAEARAVWEQARAARHRLLVDYRTPDHIEVSPERWYRLTGDRQPVLVYAVPFPKLMGLEVIPNPDIVGDDVVVSDRRPT